MDKFKKSVSALVALAGLLSLPACVNLKPAASTANSHALGPVEATAPEAAPLAAEPIYILRPQIPSYLDSSRLSYLMASGEVRNMEGSRWAEPLGEGIARAVGLFLFERNPALVEGFYPWPNTSPGASRLALNFKRFGATDSGEVHVVAYWKLMQGEGRSTSGRFHSESLGWTVGEPDSLIAAYNEALRALSQEIEAGIVEGRD